MCVFSTSCSYLMTWHSFAIKRPLCQNTLIYYHHHPPRAFMKMLLQAKVGNENSKQFLSIYICLISYLHLCTLLFFTHISNIHLKKRGCHNVVLWQLSKLISFYSCYNRAVPFQPLNEVLYGLFLKYPLGCPGAFDSIVF